MNYTINNPIGIDAKIQKVQGFIHDRIGWENIDAFGRVFKIPSKTKGDTLEAFIGKKEYKDVFLNDKVNATIFFIEDSEHKTDEGILFTNTVSVVFMVNLKKLYPDVENRADLNAQQDALRLVKKSRIIKAPRIEKDLAQILSKINIENLKLSNMQPYHVFAIEGDISYYLNSNC